MMTAKQNSINNKKGRADFITSSMGLLKTVEATKRLMPRGGVR